MSHRAAEPGPFPEAISETRVSRAIYGLITVLAVLQVLQLHPTTAWEGAVTLFGTTLAVALVDAYSESIAAMLARGHSINREELGDILHDVAPVMLGSQLPTLVLLASAAGLFSLDTALRLAEVVVFLLLFAYGVLVGQLLHASKTRWVISGLVLVAIGGIIVGIKVAFH